MGLWKGLTRALDPDRVIQTTMTGMIEATKWRYAVEGPRNPWTPGEPMKLLMAGYVGTRNTGADVRVAEMCRQIRHLMGDDRLELSLMTNDWNRSRGYFPRVRQVQMPMVFPPFLYDECPKHHGVIACEGSMFKSKFADALSTMMAGSLDDERGVQLSVGYGAERAMSEGLERSWKTTARARSLSAATCPRAARSSASASAAPGTDTAWTSGRRRLRSGGHPRALRLGRPDAGARALPDQPLLVAGEAERHQRAREGARRVRLRALPLVLLPQLGRHA